MKTVLLASLIASAAAFAPVSQPAARVSSAVSASKYADEVGVQMPLGFWDPLNVLGAEDDDIFNFVRYAEIKHGRVAMLAVVGYLTTYAGVRTGGMEDVPAGLAALRPENWNGDMASTNMYWTIGFIGFLEWFVMKDEGRASFPGDISNGVGADYWETLDDKAKLRKRGIELNNGRAAMMGILGLVVHDSMGNVDALLPLAGK